MECFPPPSVLKIDNSFINCALEATRNNDLSAIWVRLWLPDGLVVYELVTPVAVAVPQSPYRCCHSFSCSFYTESMSLMNFFVIFIFDGFFFRDTLLF